MILEFQRTGQRRYAVIARRSPLPDLEMNPAPGYDSLMPHDLLHLVVESQLGLSRGIFGQLAAGGDAGTFHPILDPHENPRENSRLSKRIRARGKILLREGRSDSARSEQAVYICSQEWLSRSRSKVAGGAASESNQARPANALLIESKLAEIFRHLDELSSRWSKLKIGESMTVSWPNLAIDEASPGFVSM